MAARVTSAGPEGANLAVHTFGSGAPSVLLLHGIPGSSRSWDAVVRELEGSCKVLVPDLLGFGASERTREIALLHARGQAAALAPALGPLLTPGTVLVGHDFGGPVALELMGRMPGVFGGLLLISTNLFPDTPVPFPLSLVRLPLAGRLAGAALFSRPSLRFMYRRGSRTRLHPGPGIGDRAQARAIATIFGESLRNLNALYSPIARAASEVRLPTLVVWGDGDPFFGTGQAKRTQDAIPGAHLQILSDCGHFVPEERPGDVARLILEMVQVAVSPEQVHAEVVAE